MMDLNVLRPRQALNKAYLKLKPTRTEIEIFKAELIKLIDQSNDTESEEFHKNLVSDFLKKTYYKEDHFINTKDTKDLVIHEGKAASTPVNVIIEAKKPTNKSEMITVDNINAKAFQETVLYFLRERILGDNKNIKYLIITNIYEWFIFDATLFEKLFVQNKKFVKEFKDFSVGRLSGTKTDFFYKEIAKPYIDSISSKVEFVHFDIRRYEKPLRNDDKKDDNKLIALYKLLSPQHLLKLPFVNDSNTLDKKFYAELLHLIGLTEVKKSGKKVIQRLPKDKRNSASLLENTIIQLDSEDEISNLKNRKQYGETSDDQLFSVGLELVISWINRILFLKLLESQLVSYHKGNQEYSFLNKSKIKNFDDLNRLFFQVLAKKQEDRNDDVKAEFSKVPYLNSSLFEPAELERKTLKISNLVDNKPLPIISSTVLKNDDGRKLTGELNTIEYLFDFLDAYDFASDTGEDIQEENKSLINASVLGLIYEKINGYKDGSFFTPGFVTMYMCRETIQQAVIGKFNDSFKWNCKTLTDVYNKIDDTEKANAVFNSIKICDPAVGSGHFLVSALNELISIKHELGILQDENGKRIKDINIDVVNDELVISDEDGELFEYKAESKESQRIQKSLFNEKQTIIENCLFGVDINPNSVKICRLRLWIELLKNAYYKEPDQLETLPNIDINIKCGNSLVSRFDYDVDLKKALKNSKIKISDYKAAVTNYKHANSKEEKRDLEDLINTIKDSVRTEIFSNDPMVKKLNKYRGELNYIESQQNLFEETSKEKKEKKKRTEFLKKNIKTLETDINEIKSNKVYENALEWRFEFPEVLDDGGTFIGFDVVIGNPPYGMVCNNQEKLFYQSHYTQCEGRFEFFELFIEKAVSLYRENGIFSFIVPNTILSNLYSKKIRHYLATKFNIKEISNFGEDVFDDPTVHTCILRLCNDPEGVKSDVDIRKQVNGPVELFNQIDYKISQPDFLNSDNCTYDIFFDPQDLPLIRKLESNLKLGDYCFIRQCIKTGDDKKYVKLSDEELSPPWKRCLRGKGVGRYNTTEQKLYLSYGDWLARNWKNKTFYETKKIVVRETGSRITATLDLDNHYLLSSLYSVYPKDDFSLDDIKCLLGVLNSSVATYYIKKIAFGLTKGAFTKVRTNQLSRLPIPDFSTHKNKLSKAVDAILALNSELVSQQEHFIYSCLPIPKVDKLSKKMHQWHALSTDEFMRELKGISELSLNQVEESEMSNLFEKKCREISIIKTKSKIIDNEIDEIVFELYSLNKNERNIISNDLCLN